LVNSVNISNISTILSECVMQHQFVFVVVVVVIVTVA